MLYVSDYSEEDGKWGIKDTVDGLLEYVSEEEIRKAIKRGIQIIGVSPDKIECLCEVEAMDKRMILMQLALKDRISYDTHFTATGTAKEIIIDCSELQETNLISIPARYSLLNAENTIVYIQDLTWHTIKSNQFYNMDSVRRVVVDKGVVNLTYHAFSYFKHLKSIKLPDTVKKISKDAFEDCSELEELIIGNKRVTI